MSTPSNSRQRFGVSTYSFWHFRGPKVEILDCIERAAEWGFDGVEVLHQQMTSEEKPYLQEIKRRAWRNGLDLMGFSTHQGFVFPDAAERRKNIEHTLHCIELAYALGIPTLRLNTGRWNTIKSFDALMAQNGMEPELPGYTEEDGLHWVIDSVQALLPRAAECGVTLALENHWGVGRSAKGCLRIHDALNSPWLKLLVDTGNFLEDTYTQIEACAPHAAAVHAKTYCGGGEWYTLELDYPRIAAILKRANFSGYVALEMEGKESAATAVPSSLELLRQAWK